MSTANVHLLIVDDESTTRETLSAIFGSLGYTVRSAQDGLSALRQIRGQVPDVLLSDLNMPGMSGFELLSVVRRRLPGIHVIAMSGAFSHEGVQPGVAADAFYEKATKLEGLLRMVNVKSETTPAWSKTRSTQLAPIWIQGSEQRDSIQHPEIVACPECLRVSSETIDNDGQLIREIDCRHCQAIFLLAIVSPNDPASPRSFQRKSTHLKKVDP